MAPRLRGASTLVCSTPPSAPVRAVTVGTRPGVAILRAATARELHCVVPRAGRRTSQTPVDETQGVRSTRDPSLFLWLLRKEPNVSGHAAPIVRVKDHAQEKRPEVIYID